MIRNLIAFFVLLVEIKAFDVSTIRTVHRQSFSLAVSAPERSQEIQRRYSGEKETYGRRPYKYNPMKRSLRIQERDKQAGSRSGSNSSKAGKKKRGDQIQNVIDLAILARQDSNLVNECISSFEKLVNNRLKMQCAEQKPERLSLRYM